MAGDSPRLPEQFRDPGIDTDSADFHVSELVSDAAGAHSPFGDVEFPVPPEHLTYTHPGPADLPHLLGDY